MIGIFDSDFWMTLLTRTPEYQQWNLQFDGSEHSFFTISALMTIAFNLPELLAQEHQRRKVKTGEAVSIPMYAYFVPYYMSFMVYGWFNWSISAFINGLMFLSFFPVLLALKRSKGFTSWDWIACGGFSLMVPAMIFLPWKDEMIFAFTAVSFLAYTLQCWELISNRGHGDLSIPMVVIYLISTASWIVYSWYAYQWGVFGVELLIVMAITEAYFVFFLAALLYFMLRRRPA